MLFSKIGLLPLLSLSWLGNAHVLKVNPNARQEQNIVTWDDNSLMINGERIMFLSAEFHPFRLPVASLYLDVFQKIKALGYTGVSFYVNWFLLEGKQGDFRADGVFDLQPFFDAAKQAGLYLLARPGPYINAEVAGGGFPGWMQRVQGILRTADPDFLNASVNYVMNIGKIIEANQINNGGPVILYQPENEYTSFHAGLSADPSYFQAVMDQLAASGLSVPTISNEAWMVGLFTTTTPVHVDIYGFDSYPVNFQCAAPDVWPQDLATNWLYQNEQYGPNSPFALVEFQGGSFQSPGMGGFDPCVQLTNEEFERVFYKNAWSLGTTIFNIYMTFGGTNWGNLGHSDGYTSYDYGSAITEERLVYREKYSEMKLQGNFFHVTPQYLVAERYNASLDFTDNPLVTVTPATTQTTKFYISRHTQFDSTDTVAYKLKVMTVNYGDIMIPQNSESLFLNGRDSKIHVSDYPVGDYNIVYSSAEIFTWKKYADKTVLIVYGGLDEVHEVALEGQMAPEDGLICGSGVTIDQKYGYIVFNWMVSPERVVAKIGSLYIYMLSRNEAYNYFVPPYPGATGTSDVIVKAGYLIRTVEVDYYTLNLMGDVNSTTAIEIIGGAPPGLKTLNFNGQPLEFTQGDDGVVSATVSFEVPQLTIPKLGELQWKKADTLPEITADYSDAAWTAADLKQTYNTANQQMTPTSLFAGDYGYHTRMLIYRGHFTANGQEKELFIETQGGQAFGSSVWINEEFVGSWLGAGGDINFNANETYTLPCALVSGTEYVLTVVVENMGLSENWWVGDESMKQPRGIIRYELSGHEDQGDIAWKITGNLGGEDYMDKARGPLNEGGLWAERQGYHQPGAPTDSWADSTGPTEGFDKPGIMFYTASFDLDLPAGYDIPLSFVFTNTTAAQAYRAQLYVNGYQYGSLWSNVGPQKSFPVPQGILDFNGKNYIAVSVWALEQGGAKPEGFDLEVGMITATGYTVAQNAPMPQWEMRSGAY